MPDLCADSKQPQQLRRLRQFGNELEQRVAAPRVGEQDPAGHEDRGERDRLAAEHDPVHVDRRLPGRAAVFDDPRSGGAGHQAEAAASAGVDSLVVAHAAAASAANGRRGNHGEPVLLVGLAVDALDAHYVARARNELLQLHGSSFSVDRSTSIPPPAVPRHPRSRGFTKPNLFTVRSGRGAAGAGAPAGLQNPSGLAAPGWLGSTPGPLRPEKLPQIALFFQVRERQARTSRSGSTRRRQGI